MKEGYQGKYNLGSTEPYRISRSKIELFMRCQRCFWLDRRFGIKHPSTPPFNINKAIDELYKNEFDTYRAKGQPHPLMSKHKIAAVPYAHKNLEDWRENFVGVQRLHEPTNLLVFGAVDDIWKSESGELIIVDYKATAKKTEVNLNSPWQIAYKRQIEVYQWLLRGQSLKDVEGISDRGWFVYTNAISTAEKFDDKLNFRTKLIPYDGNDSWVDGVLIEIKHCLDNNSMPDSSADCEYCEYTNTRVKKGIEIAKLNSH